MTTETSPYDWMSRDDARYTRVCNMLREAGFTALWLDRIETGALSCWGRSKTTLLVQQLGDGVEIYSNADTPRTFEDIAEWLNPC